MVALEIGKYKKVYDRCTITVSVVIFVAVVAGVVVAGVDPSTRNLMVRGAF